MRARGGEIRDPLDEAEKDKNQKAFRKSGFNEALGLGNDTSSSMTYGEWCKANGYDPVTRTYSEVEAAAPAAPTMVIHKYRRGRNRRPRGEPE